ncbi:MAG: peptide deformylase [Elusimicrobia bacterium GWC2_51_8]|nr:MAG: peptide deformylase [Elusimicrobia bacterium GWA2_51_34]OGR58744.1 MAG: peptide deformylase [Elusimicrobia bacterium GWC2_51_8]OGR86239.1 MAG: peptide deformylase [Elusimicrobia bacterium GWF2_52_66]HAF96369.1 peptide deformylase [Elusimicrobiota bacterium]HCE98555.1 peptide deformylase [Elusimicrobiota bacterium]
MAARRVCKYGENILRKRTKPVNFPAQKDELPGIIADMFETMSAAGGVGLSANQIGLDLRLSVIRIARENEPEIKLVLINPEIMSARGRQDGEEGCLSFPGLFARVRRFENVKVRSLNKRGLPVEINARGFLARALQHEIDHLDGVLFIDRTPFLTRLKLKPVLASLKLGWSKLIV